MDNFLNDLEFPTIDLGLAIIDLERPLRVDEVKEAIRSMQSGKAPGTDGYGTEFYKDIFRQACSNPIRYV